MGRPVSGITGSAGIVVDVDVEVDDADEVVEDDDVDDELVDPGTVVAGMVASGAAVEADEELLLLLHAASASAATMNVVVDLVDFTVSLSSANALFERGSVTSMCSRARHR